MSSQRTVTNIFIHIFISLLKNCFSFRCACLEWKYYFCNYLSIFHFGQIWSLDFLFILSIAISVIYLIDRFYYYGYSNFTQQILFVRVASCSALIQPTLFVIVYWGEGGEDVPLLSLKTSLAQIRSFSHLQIHCVLYCYLTERGILHTEGQRNFTVHKISEITITQRASILLHGAFSFFLFP